MSTEADVPEHSYAHCAIRTIAMATCGEPHASVLCLAMPYRETFPEMLVLSLYDGVGSEDRRWL